MMPEKYLTPKEVASILDVSYGTALDLIKYSGVPHKRIGRQYRVSPDELNAFLRKNSSIAISAEMARNRQK